MDTTALLFHIQRLEQRCNTLEATVTRQDKIIRQQAETIKQQAAKILQLEATLQQYAEAKSSKKPKFGLNYSSQRNEPKEKTKRKQKTSRKPAGRKPKKDKPDQAHCVRNIYPNGISPKKCVFAREQFVWRLIDHKAQYVHYKLYDLPVSKTPPTIPGVRHASSEYGIEFLIVNWMCLVLRRSRSGS